MNHHILHCFIFLYLLVGCTNAPQLNRADLSFPEKEIGGEPSGGSRDSLLALIGSVTGSQFGDEIFLRSTSVRLITPMVDVLALRAAAEGNKLTDVEYEARLKRLAEIHNRYFIFALELLMPLYTGWTQAELLSYLEQNLSITLENGSKSLFYPERLNLKLPDTVYPDATRPIGAKLHIRVPARVYFNKQVEQDQVLSDKVNQLILKLRLVDPPPFRVGFFDEKFYQGFRWLLVN